MAMIQTLLIVTLWRRTTTATRTLRCRNAAEVVGKLWKKGTQVVMMRKKGAWKIKTLSAIHLAGKSMQMDVKSLVVCASKLVRPLFH